MVALQKKNDDERKQSRYPKRFLEEETEDLDITHLPNEEQYENRTR